MRDDVARARKLRKCMSESEVILWSRLRRLRQRGFHVRRQAPFKGYFLDFVCYARRLVIEVDGSQHAAERQAGHDFLRDRVLARHGFTVLRFTAGEVKRDADSVMDRIAMALEAAGPVRDSSADAEPSPDFPTLAASRPVPPH